MQLDKQADFLIADHAKKDVPSGSYSWKWIEESVKNGKLADKEDYSIKVPRTESRPGGSMPQKGTRNAFTKQDDLLLAQFVTRHEKQGTAVSGNVIYKQLESKVRLTAVPRLPCANPYSIRITRFSLGEIAGSRSYNSFLGHGCQTAHHHHPQPMRKLPCPRTRIS